MIISLLPGACLPDLAKKFAKAEYIKYFVNTKPKPCDLIIARFWHLQEQEQQQSFVNRQNFRQAGQSTPITTEEEASYLTTPLQPDYGQAATLHFDGQNLIWQQNGRPVKSWPAMSGKPYAQGKEFTNYANEGPIPEGNWMLKQNTGEHYNPGEWRTFDEFISGTGVWKLQPNSWGNSRIPIQPQQGTNAFGRHSMYVHGGVVPSSSGCIDLTGSMNNFYNDFKNYNGNIPLTVQYPDSFTNNK